MVKLTRIYTRAGDQGKTALGNGQCVSKTSCRVDAMGTVDEANAALGVAFAHLPSDNEHSARTIIHRLQQELFDVGADLCMPNPDKGSRLTNDYVVRLERDIDQLNESLKSLDSFVIPGGCLAAAHLHVARTVCRRSERLAFQVAETEFVNDVVLRYLNRLSDLLFVLSRSLNALYEGDVLWIQHRNAPGKDPRS